MEKINFKFELKINTHDAVNEHPFVNISINGFPQFGEILDKDTTIDIDVEIEDNTNNFLSIEYCNKNPKTDVVLGEDGMPVQDKTIEISKIYIDEIEIDYFALTDPSVLQYTSIDPQGIDATGFEATKLCWNGKTTLNFTTPVYIWLLENL